VKIVTWAREKSRLKKLLLLVALLMAPPSIAGPSPQQLIVGKWQSTQDKRSFVEAKADGTWIDSYKGMADATVVSHWLVFNGSHPPNESEGQLMAGPIVGQLYLEVRNGDGDFLFYGLDRVDQKTMQLTYLGRGNLLQYRRVM
jgi:hypothetical protein